MATRPTEERIAELEEKMKQLKAQKRALQARQSQEERKKRTKRLIELGGYVESILNTQGFDVCDASVQDAIRKFLSNNADKIAMTMNKYLEKDNKTSATQNENDSQESELVVNDR